MNFFNRAIKNVTRRLSKTILLTIAFFMIGNFVIVGLGVANATENAKTLTRQKMRAVVTFRTDYDAIYTGDLGKVGSELLYSILQENQVDIKPVHQDCGLMMYYLKEQDVHAGASGCGCCASVLCGHILPKMERGELHRVLFCPTGALMSVTSSQQGQPIPGICHAIELRV